MKRFAVFTEASVADPTHQIAVSVMDEAETTVMHCSSIQPLIDAAISVEIARAKTQGRNEGTQKVLDLFGISMDQYLEKLGIVK